jgi:hypothetical protein
MLRNVYVLTACLASTLVVPFIHAQDNGDAQAVRGINPADNLTKFELLPKFTMLDADSDTSISTLTLKYDRAFQAVYGVNIELPLAYFHTAGSDELGIGDVNVRGRYQHRAGRWTIITGAETVLPVASDDTLGSGKYQLNPTVAVVHAFSAQTFAALAVKHLFSVAGDRDRADIVQGHYRLLGAHATATGWWFLLDPQLWVDYEQNSRLHIVTEGEIGHMINKTTGVWLRGGGHVAGNWQKDDWTISAGIRFISF